MPETDLLDNVPPNPEGFKPYRPPPPSAAYQPPVVYPPSGNGLPGQAPGQFSQIPDNIFGWFMLMLGL